MQQTADLATLIADARRGSEAAWTRLYRALSPDVMRYLVAHGIDDAGDVLGGAFIDLARALPRFRGGEAALRTLTFGLVHQRLAGRRHPSPSSSRSIDRVLDSASREVAGGNAARAAALSGRMRQRFRLLSETRQETVLLRVFGQLSEEEALRTMSGASAAPRALRTFRLTERGAAVLETASALMRALPPPATRALEPQHVAEAAASARGLIATDDER